MYKQRAGSVVASLAKIMHGLCRLCFHMSFPRHGEPLAFTDPLAKRSSVNELAFPDTDSDTDDRREQEKESQLLVLCCCRQMIEINWGACYNNNVLGTMVRLSLSLFPLYLFSFSISCYRDSQIPRCRLWWGGECSYFPSFFLKETLPPSCGDPSLPSSSPLPCYRGCIRSSHHHHTAGELFFH